ncbi:MAG: dicarboxylate/amino acid:cation symporter [Legionella sp.]|uniref:dicarboxylate/amino acid:cation symporter n=1 Tax=Legionella sp. TaxID=459 RepID=UPI0039E5B7F9
MTAVKKALGNYFFSSILIASILLGGVTGYYFGKLTLYLKPLGEIFLNLIFTAIVPLIFFSITSAITRVSSMTKLAKIILYMALVFLFTGAIAAIYSLAVIMIFPPALDVSLPITTTKEITAGNVLNQIAGIFTVSNFSQLLTHKHILALIVFSILVGIAAANTKEKSKSFIDVLHASEEVFMRVFTLIMYYAPIGFFAYFAVLVQELGPQLMHHYLRVTLLYYSCSIVYFIFAFSLYAYLAGKMKGVKLFWSHIFLPAITAIATCSSAACIPANLVATQKMRVSPEIYETVIPLGSIIHKDGSVIGGMFKIAFLFGVFHWDFSGASILLTALGVSILVGTVMGAIPSGGMLGELLILSVYGFPPSVLIAIAAISILIDPLATLINVTCNSVSSMLVARLVEGKKWLNDKYQVY